MKLVLCKSFLCSASFVKNIEQNNANTWQSSLSAMLFCVPFWIAGIRHDFGNLSHRFYLNDFGGLLDFFPMKVRVLLSGGRPHAAVVISHASNWSRSVPVSRQQLRLSASESGSRGWRRSPGAIAPLVCQMFVLCIAPVAVLSYRRRLLWESGTIIYQSVSLDNILHLDTSTRRFSSCLINRHTRLSVGSSSPLARDCLLEFPFTKWL